MSYKRWFIIIICKIETEERRCSSQIEIGNLVAELLSTGGQKFLKTWSSWQKPASHSALELFCSVSIFLGLGPNILTRSSAGLSRVSELCKFIYLLGIKSSVDFLAHTFLLAPKASEASKGAFHLFPGVPSGYCDA